MKSLAALAMLSFALSFCGVLNRFTGAGGTSSNSAGAPVFGTGDKNIEFEKPELTDVQTAIADGGKEMSWEKEGMTWRVPPTWKKQSEERNMYLLMSPDIASLIVNLSPMPADFPVDISLKGTYDQALNRMKNGEVETVRYLELDGVRGVEFVEAKTENKENPRRHQWIAFRKYGGQSQMINLMLATKDGNFDKHRNEFAAVLASSKIVHGE